LAIEKSFPSVKLESFFITSSIDGRKSSRYARISNREHSKGSKNQIIINKCLDTFSIRAPMLPAYDFLGGDDEDFDF